MTVPTRIGPYARFTLVFPPSGDAGTLVWDDGEKTRVVAAKQPDGTPDDVFEWLCGSAAAFRAVDMRVNRRNGEYIVVRRA